MRNGLHSRGSWPQSPGQGSGVRARDCSHFRQVRSAEPGGRPRPPGLEAEALSPRQASGTELGLVLTFPPRPVPPESPSAAPEGRYRVPLPRVGGGQKRAGTRQVPGRQSQGARPPLPPASPQGPPVPRPRAPPPAAPRSRSRSAPAELCALPGPTAARAAGGPRPGPGFPRTRPPR